MYNKNNSGFKEYGFNGRATVGEKVAENKKLGIPGIMFWQLAGDLPVNDEKSLLRTISIKSKD